MQLAILQAVVVGVACLLCSDELSAGPTISWAPAHVPVARSPSRIAALMHVPPDQDKQPSPNITQLGLGAERTVVLVFATDCKECVPLLEFYKTLLNAPGMDGKRKRMVVLALDGVVPVRKLLETHGFKPHRLTSYPRIENTIELPDRGPGILVVDGGGVRLGMWTGALTEAQQKEVIAAVGG